MIWQDNIIKKFEYIQDELLDMEEFLGVVDDDKKKLDPGIVISMLYIVRKNVGLLKENYINSLKEQKGEKND